MRGNEGKSSLCSATVEAPKGLGRSVCVITVRSEVGVRNNLTVPYALSRCMQPKMEPRVAGLNHPRRGICQNVGDPVTVLVLKLGTNIGVSKNKSIGTT
jgi:hypothetical protein